LGSSMPDTPERQANVGLPDANVSRLEGARLRRFGEAWWDLSLPLMPYIAGGSTPQRLQSFRRKIR
jgi:hypothetical protein